MRAEQVELPAAVRLEVGKTAARRLRRAGKIPAVVYGRGQDAIPIAVDEAVFSRSLSAGSWYSAVIQLEIEGAEAAEARPTVMIKEVQRDLVRRRLLSVDFRRISLQEVIQTHVPVLTVGESPGIKQGGILEHISHEVVIECLPADIPDHLEVDISALEITDSLRARDIVAPPGVRIVTPEDDVIAVVAPPARVEEVAPAPAAEEAAVVEEAAEPEVIREREPEEES